MNRHGCWQDRAKPAATRCAHSLPPGLPLNPRNTQPSDCEFQYVFVFHVGMLLLASYQRCSYLKATETNSVDLSFAGCWPYPSPACPLLCSALQGRTRLPLGRFCQWCPSGSAEEGRRGDTRGLSPSLLCHRPCPCLWLCVLSSTSHQKAMIQAHCLAPACGIRKHTFSHCDSSSGGGSNTLQLFIFGLPPHFWLGFSAFPPPCQFLILHTCS